MMVITRSEPGGAQVHLRDLVDGLREELDLCVVSGEPGFLVEACARLGVRAEVEPALVWPISPPQDWRGWRALRRRIRAFAPDLVHTHSSKAGLLGRLAARAEGVPAIHTAHAWSFSDGLPWTRRALAIPPELLVGRQSARIIAVSEADRALARRYRIASEARLRVIHNGVPDVDARARPEAGDPPLLVTVARMQAPKDHALLLGALARVRAPWRLRLVGDGPLRPAVEARIDALGLRPRVELLGRRSDVPALLAEAQVALLCSAQEGFPLVVLEAMRAGLPVIASDVGGVAEAVLEGRTGLRVARGDEAGWARALERLLGDPISRAAMGAAGRLRYQERFTVEAMVRATRAVYDEVLAEVPADVPAEVAAEVPAEVLQ